MSKNSLKEKRLKAMEKYIKKSVRWKIKITESSIEYGVIGGKYLCDGYCFVTTSDDMASLPQSKNEIKNNLDNQLEYDKNLIEIDKTYNIDINKLIADIKADGFKDTIKQLEYEEHHLNEKFVVYINDTFIDYRLFYKAYTCIDNNDICIVSDISDYKNPIYIKNDIGECVILPFNTFGKTEDTINEYRCYNLLDYVV